MKKKLLSLFLAFSMLTGMVALTACDQNDPATTTADSTTTAVPETTQDPGEVFTPIDTRYDKEFNFLISGYNGSNQSAFRDFSEIDEAERTTLEQGVYKTFESVKDLYGITFNLIEDFGSKNTAKTRIQTMVTAGDGDYDAAFVAAYDAVPLATSESLYELSNLPVLSLESSWWDQRANTELTIHDCLFFTTGDIDFWDDMQQNAIAFNKQVKNDLNIEDDFYQLVADGEWTHEALAKYAKIATEDLNSDGVKDMSDQFGIITWDDSVYAIFNGSGEKVITADKNGALSLTLTGSERIVDVLTSYTNICFGGDAINYQRYTAQEAINMFSSNRALFFLGRLQTLDNFRDMETDYGILPYPKYTADQESYYTTSSPYHLSFVCVPATVSDPEMSGAVLDALAYYGQVNMTPAYYEKTLTGQYFRDEDSIQTLELMAATRSYDLGLYVQPANINKELIFLFRKGSTDFVSTFDSYKTAAETALTELDESYRKAAAEWK